MSSENGSVKVENGSNGTTGSETVPKKEVIDGEVVPKEEDSAPAAKRSKVEVDDATRDKVLTQMEVINDTPDLMIHISLCRICIQGLFLVSVTVLLRRCQLAQGHIHEVGDGK